MENNINNTVNNSADLAEIEDWWKRELDQLALVNLPVDYCETCPSSETDHWIQYLDKVSTSSIVTFIEDQGLRPIVFFDSICRLLFYRYTQQSDISWLITGSLDDSNNNVRLVSRYNLNGQSNFSQFCYQIENYYNQLIVNNYKLLSLPVDEIAKSLEPKSLNVHLIETINQTIDGETQLTDSHDHDLVIKFNLDKSNCHLSIDYRYKVDYFKKSTIKRLGNHFVNLIKSVINGNNLNCQLNDHELLDDSERKQLESFNQLLDYDTTIGSESFFIAAFYKAAYANAHSIAIQEQSRTITYQKLNERSNQLARYLASVHNVKRGDMVAIMLPQGIDNFITLLAILKLGSAFVPLGVDYPVDRIKYILTDCDEPFLITSDELFPSIKYYKLLNYSDIDKQLSSQSLGDLPCILNKNDLAYCMYTSGSTGQPKGVLISQRTISFMATIFTNIFSVTQATRSSLISATAFDATICESFPVLINGGLLILPDLENRYDHNYLISWLTKEHINYCYLPAKILDLIFESDLHLKVTHSIKVWASGEPLGAVKVTEKSNIEVFNVLGMTELTPLTYVKVNSLKDPRDFIKPPVGSPVPGVQVYITDSLGRLCPIGVVGHITYSSTLLALGYHKLPEQTEEKFTTDPFNGHLIEGSRLLKSGDLARWREDGLIEFYGRADDQVKVRGYRIELSEIEKLLNGFQGVHQSTVLIRKGKRHEDSRIVAYLILFEEKNKAERFEQSTSWRKNFGSNLHSYLRSHLPYFMLPQVFIIPQFPLNKNGKVDKKVLFSLDNCEPLMSSMFSGATTQMEYDMVKIWAQALMIPVESLGIDDNFFELGGHSLMAATIVGQLNQPPFSYPITTRMVLTLATVRSICDLIVSDSLPNISIQSIPVLKSRTGIGLGVSQSWMGMIEIATEGSGMMNEFTYFMAPDKLDWKLVERAVNCLIERHEAFRLTLSISHLHKITQSVINFKPITISIVNCSTLEEMESHANQLARSITNIFNGSQPLVKFSFVQFNCKRLIFMAASHLVMDGVSFELTAKELRLMFDCLQSGVEIKLPPVKTSFLDYIDWESRNFYKDNDLINRGKAFWLERLKGFKVPRLPLLLSVLLCIGDEVVTEWLCFNDEVTSLVDNILKEYRTTLFVFTQAILLALLHLHSDSTDLTIYKVTRNTNHHAAIQLIGNLATVNFSRVTWKSDQNVTFVDLLRITHHSTMKEYEFKFFDFQNLINESEEDEDHGFEDLVPVTITTGVDREEPLDILKAISSTKKATNALVLNFMKIQSRYTLEFSYAKHGFDADVMRSFLNCTRHFIEKVAHDPTQQLGQYLADPNTIIHW